MSHSDDARRTQTPRNWGIPFHGKFASDADAVGDLLPVIIPTFGDSENSDITWGPCSWAPEWGDSTLPRKGDPCLVMFDDQRRPWVMRWIPSFYVPSSGGGTSSFRYVYVQTLPSSTWVIVHNLNGYPNVTVVDDTPSVSQIEGDVTYPDANHVIVSFASAVAGKAFLS